MTFEGGTDSELQNVVYNNLSHTPWVNSKPKKHHSDHGRSLKTRRKHFGKAGIFIQLLETGVSSALLCEET
jgi:hypothetical protein